MGLTFKDVDEILKLIDEAGFAEVKLEFNGLSLHVVSRGAVPSASIAPSSGPAPEAVHEKPRAESLPVGARAGGAPSASGQPPAVPEVPAGMMAVRAPMAGTFYRAASPGAKPFAEVGTIVGASDTVCLLEVMKLFTSVNAGVDGRVVAVLVEDAAAVTLRQPLFIIEPAAR